jgi:hypothetical protein
MAIHRTSRNPYFEVIHSVPDARLKGGHDKKMRFSSRPEQSASSTAGKVVPEPASAAKSAIAPGAHPA